MLRRRRAGGRSLYGTYSRNAVAVDVRPDPVHVQQTMIRAIRNHAAKLRIETGDQRLYTGARPPDGEIELSRQERRRPDLQPGSRFLRIVADDVLDDEIVHQRVVHLTLQQTREAVFFAARSHENRSGVIHRVAIRIADDRHSLAAKIGNGLRRNIGASPPDEHEPVLRCG